MVQVEGALGQAVMVAVPWCAMARGPVRRALGPVTGTRDHDRAEQQELVKRGAGPATRAAGYGLTQQVLVLAQHSSCWLWPNTAAAGDDLT